MTKPTPTAIRRPFLSSDLERLGGALRRYGLKSRDWGEGLLWLADRVLEAKADGHGEIELQLDARSKTLRDIEQGLDEIRDMVRSMRGGR